MRHTETIILENSMIMTIMTHKNLRGISITNGT